MKTIGCDIIEIKRIEKAMEKENFLQRWFSDREQKLFELKKFLPQTVAGNFAAKEAFVKALGTGFSGIRPADIEILRDEKGKPIVRAKGISQKCDVSISHCQEYAMAVVLMEKDEL